MFDLRYFLISFVVCLSISAFANENGSMFDAVSAGENDQVSQTSGSSAYDYVSDADMEVLLEEAEDKVDDLFEKAEKYEQKAEKLAKKKEQDLTKSQKKLTKLENELKDAQEKANKAKLNAQQASANANTTKEFYDAQRLHEKANELEIEVKKKEQEILKQKKKIEEIKARPTDPIENNKYKQAKKQSEGKLEKVEKLKKKEAKLEQGFKMSKIPTWARNAARGILKFGKFLVSDYFEAGIGMYQGTVDAWSALMEGDKEKFVEAFIKVNQSLAKIALNLMVDLIPGGFITKIGLKVLLDAALGMAIDRLAESEFLRNIFNEFGQVRFDLLSALLQKDISGFVDAFTKEMLLFVQKYKQAFEYTPLGMLITFHKQVANLRDLAFRLLRLFIQQKLQGVTLNDVFGTAKDADIITPPVDSNDTKGQNDVIFPKLQEHVVY